MTPYGTPGTWKLGTHQICAIACMDANDGLMLAYDMGTGKTAIALSWALAALKDGRIPDFLVVCPATLVSNWEDAIGKMIMFEGVTEADVDLLRRSAHVVSFQKTYRTEKKVIHKRDGTIETKRVRSLREDVDRRWGAIIIDEAHCIGAHDSVQTKAAHTLARLTDHRYAMSATFFHGGKGAQDFSKLYGVGNFICPGTWRTWTEFCGQMVAQMDIWKKPRKYHEDKCVEWVTTHGIACRIEDCYDMPETMSRTIGCQMSPDSKKAYVDIRSGRLDGYGLEITMAGTAWTKMRQICSGSLKTDTMGTLTYECTKDDKLREIFDQIIGKVVVFCTYRASIDRCMEIARQCGRNPIAFDARANGKPVWKDFQYGDADVLVGQYTCGGPGVDLFAASHMVFYEPCSSARDFKQAHGRIYRKGQTHPCMYIYLATVDNGKDTIETKALRTVMSGQDVSDRMQQEWARADAIGT